MILRPRSFVLILLGLFFGVSNSFAEESSAQRVGELLAEGTELALEGKKKPALRILQKAAILEPNSLQVQAALGQAALLLGDYIQARRILKRLDQPTYYAMALAHQPGGLAKAKSVLAKASKGDLSPASTYFLASLAFFDAGQPKRADRLLAKALKKSSSAMSDSFAPDPAVGLVKSVWDFSKETKFSAQLQARLAMALHLSGRRGAAYQWAMSKVDHPSLKSAALRVLVLIENISYSRSTLRKVQKVLREEPDSADAKVAEILLLVRLEKWETAKSRLDKLPSISDEHLRASIAEARLRIELATEPGDNELLITAEEAMKAAPDSNIVLGLMIEALVKANKLERAKAYAVTLAKKKPTEIDPYQLLIKVQQRRSKTKNLPRLRARSALVQKSMASLNQAVKKREEVIRSVRQAEASSVSVSALPALRSEAPSLSLPIDLAIGRLGTRGQARSARERVLSACSQKLKSILRAREGYDWVRVKTRPYGQLEQAMAPLSGANPSRCNTKTLRRP